MRSKLLACLLASESPEIICVVGLGLRSVYSFSSPLNITVVRIAENMCRHSGAYCHALCELISILMSAPQRLYRLITRLW